MKKGAYHKYTPFYSEFALRLRSIYRTYVCAVTALNALVRIDLVLRVSLSDAGYGAFACASAALDAIIVDCVSHSDSPLHLKITSLS